MFHYLFATDDESRDRIVAEGLRPLSDFPDSERWRQTEAEMPGFYEHLYDLIARPVLGRPYENSGVFVTPIDLHSVPDTFLSDKPRFRIPVSRLDPSASVITYVRDDERATLPLSSENLALTAAIWDAAEVKAWFGIDRTKVFFYVPQIAAYQGRIEVHEDEFEAAPGEG